MTQSWLTSFQSTSTFDVKGVGSGGDTSNLGTCADECGRLPCWLASRIKNSHFPILERISFALVTLQTLQ